MFDPHPRGGPAELRDGYLRPLHEADPLGREVIVEQGRIFAGQDVRIGGYSDTVLVTVNY